MIVQDITGANQYSYSKITAFEQCPWQYYLKYVKKVQDGRDNGFAQAGKVAHDLIDEYYSKGLEAEKLPELFEQKWQKKFVEPGFRVELNVNGFVKDLSDNYHNQILNYFNNFVAYDNCQVMATEQRYNAFLQEWTGGKSILLTGILDCLGKDSDGNYVIWDSKSKSAWKDAAEIAKYARQLYVYSTFVKMKYGNFPAKLKFNQFRLTGNKRVTEIPFDETEYENVMLWLFEMVRSIESEQMFLPTPDDFYCNNLCEFRDVCQERERKAEEIY